MSFFGCFFQLQAWFIVICFVKIRQVLWKFQFYFNYVRLFLFIELSYYQIIVIFWNNYQLRYYSTRVHNPQCWLRCRCLRRRADEPHRSNTIANRRPGGQQPGLLIWLRSPKGGKLQWRVRIFVFLNQWTIRSPSLFSECQILVFLDEIRFFLACPTLKLLNPFSDAIMFLRRLAAISRLLTSWHACFFVTRSPSLALVMNLSFFLSLHHFFLISECSRLKIPEFLHLKRLSFYWPFRGVPTSTKGLTCESRSKCSRFK